MAAIITLLTDFGTADGYVGELKGTLLSLAPGATVIDISHEIAPHDVEMGRLALARYWRRFPGGTTHIVVVDPGVGTARAALAVSSNGVFLVGPDNGVLSPALVMPGAGAVSLNVPADASPSFHGRDVFAPAAARLASGESPGALGVPFDHPIIQRTPEVRRSASGDLEGQVIAIDRFGNAITNLVGGNDRVVVFGDRALALQRTYGDLAPGEAGAIVGSSGLIEIVVRQGRASDALRIARGARVLLRKRTA